MKIYHELTFEVFVIKYTCMIHNAELVDMKNKHRYRDQIFIYMQVCVDRFSYNFHDTNIDFISEILNRQRAGF